MVAASKMRKAQQAAIAAAPFARLLYRIQRKSRRTRAAISTHPLLRSARGPQARGHSDRRRQGTVRRAQHATSSAMAAQFDPESTIFITAGRKAAQFIARIRRQLAAEFAYGDTPTFAEARAIAAFARDLFLKRRGGPGADRRHPFRQHADPGAGHARVPAGRRDQGR